MKATIPNILLSQGTNTDDKVNIMPHNSKDNIVVIRKGLREIGFVKFEGGMSSLNWADSDYNTHHRMLPYTDLWDNFTLEDAEYLAKRFLL